MSRVGSASNTSIHGNAQSDGQCKSRYFLHHHGPDHHQGRSLSSFKQHMSSSALGHLISTASQKHLSRQHKTTHRFKFSSSSSLSQNHIHLHKEVNNHYKGDNAVSEVLLKGHVFVRATCTRLRDPCEFCQHSVHGHSYLYCRNCPVVIHNKDICQEQLTRVCPAPEIGIVGWGEGNYSIKFEENPPIDLEAVFLSALPGLQSNKCFECGRILDLHTGHELRPNNNVNDDNSLSSNTIKPIKRQKSHKEVFSHIRRVRSHHQFGQIDSAPLASAMRICYVTGKYYCERCHWDDRWYVPGSIFLLNDTSKQPVCRSMYIKLRVIWDSLVMRIPAYWHQDNLEAEQVFEVRNKLHPLLRYALLCPEASSIKASVELADPIYLLGSPEYFRMCDVLNVLNGTLYSRLEKCLKIWCEHKTHCEICGEDEKAVENDGAIWLGNKLS
ncbi:hypothetical protein MN116_001596 [Schistosoma mekongi]|uniref:Rubicon Homology domain-containing protein n=1 Tax=Schistosoma mekongi TaxID=38744 RepID=A0AAE1ZHK5_SCHME|nr:hypothetical protein MN116_001596 [Schistosoma mekongi]